LVNLLQINPYYRKPVSELIKSPIFESIRVPELEKPADGRIMFEIDCMNAFDYDNGTDRAMSGIDAYRKAILKEIRKIKQD
jgi:hypothetical protein